jgi:predicted NBD/HSP70 family sugar kinase
MPDHAVSSQGLVRHGGTELPSVIVDGYNAELRDAEGFIGDRASKRAFQQILEDWRERLRKIGEDPLGETPTGDIGKKQMEKLLVEGDPDQAALIHAAVEEFAQELATVTRRLLRLKAWRDTERIAVGGGFRMGRVGELAIGRAGLLLKADGVDVTYQPICHHPDEAGLIGAVHLAPSWMFSGHDSILAVDVGGTNIRCGIVELNLKKASDLSATHVMAFDLWRHRGEDPKREEAVEKLASMLKALIRRAEKDKRSLAPFIGIGCPGLIREDGHIERGGQNLPGNWESSRFHLPSRIRELIPEIGGHDTLIVMHNDAVVQGLSEVPLMQDVKHWGILTIGTGLGNARFTNRTAKDAA